MKLKSLLFASALGAILFMSCKKDKNNQTNPPQTITDIVSSDTTFSVLKAAIVKADLATTLSGVGPFTVFAPNNAAFTASGLGMATVNSLSAADLSKILLYHTLASKVLSGQVPAGPNAKVVTASGDSVFVTNKGSGVFVNGIPVVKADVLASNGVIHVLAKVLMPPVGNLVQTAQTDTTFSYLVAAVIRASQGSTDVAGVLSTGGIFTLFAPTNNAFRAAGFPTIASINAADPATLTTILTYHVIPGRIFSSDLTNGAKPATVNGGTLTVLLTSGAQIKGNTNTTASNIVATNIAATNGVVHVIDQVLLP